MSTTARRRGAGRRWDVPATPATPDATAKTKKAPAQPKHAPPAHEEGSIEAARRRLHRLALDVHDGPMQNLAVIGFSLGDLRRRLRALVPADDQAGIDACIEQIGAELGRVETDLRALIVALEHGGVASVPVVDAVEQEIEGFKRRSAVPTELIVVGDVRTETDSQRIALQSITRSALANVAKHAAATSVIVRLIGAVDSVRLEIEDDGCGFDPSQPPKQGHFGLSGMRERVAMLGGTFDVQSRVGGPTKIIATLEMWRPPAAT